MQRLIPSVMESSDFAELISRAYLGLTEVSEAKHVLLCTDEMEACLLLYNLIYEDDRFAESAQYSQSAWYAKDS